MNKIQLCLTAALIAGPVRGNETLAPFQPAMASLSNELEFDALRGRVKNFEQVLLGSDEGQLTIAKGRFDLHGCLKEYERMDFVNGQSIRLARADNSNTLVSARDKRNTIVLNKACQIVGTTNSASPVSKLYIYDKNLLVKVKDARNAWVYKEYFYTPEGMPESTVFYGEEHDVLLITVPKRKLAEPWDFITQGLDNGVPFYQALKKCHYDKKGNPSVCDFVVDTLIQGGATETEHQQIRYTTTYY
ncbi:MULTISPECIES: YnfC family lipoprotein [Tenebrionibacter/Tenebrionicola group]|jgi:hypothetical protein|uniref:YnfC family lipoprotein n=1 Tax=Tenebrionibacter/Tenebrionicola group TaxID=2969848 RepID=UPI001EE853CE|nr:MULTISPECIES: YnfC family lipoprotein [Tenebrionibacter/Tenebrionicola group]